MIVIHYQGLEMDGKIFKNGEEVKTISNLESIVENSSNSHITFDNKYHFYQTPSEMVDCEEFVIELDGVKFPGWGIFRNRTRTLVIKELKKD